MFRLNGPVRRRPPWDEALPVVQMRPLRPEHVWSRHVRLAMADAERDVALSAENCRRSVHASPPRRESRARRRIDEMLDRTTDSVGRRKPQCRGGADLGFAFATFERRPTSWPRSIAARADGHLRIASLRVVLRTFELSIEMLDRPQQELLRLLFRPGETRC